ncbi:MAG: hypothetical protein AB7G93_13790 [Bdellovibrionales bacterium]
MGKAGQVLLALGSFVLIVTFQNCGQGFQGARFSLGEKSLMSGEDERAAPNVNPNPFDERGSEPISEPVSGPVLETWNDLYPAPIAAADCLDNPDYNLCLSYKDPVTTNGGQALSPALSSVSATLTQEKKVFSYGVKVPATGPLVNDNFLLELGGLTAVMPTSAGDWKVRVNGDAHHGMAQLHSWYWLNREISYFLERTGTFYATASHTQRKLTVRPYMAEIRNNAYFRASDYSLSFGYSDLNQGGQKVAIALDGAVMTHELGHANLYAANPGTILNDRKAVLCFSNTAACCSNSDGCMRAIHEGVGDLHAKFVFPEADGSMADFLMNSDAGLPARDLDQMESSGLTAGQLFARSGGEVHLFGMAYASIWYGVWKKAKSSGNEKEIETLFMEHLAALSGDDTFLTAYTAIAALADELFSATRAGQIKADFEEGYNRLGLAL